MKQILTIVAFVSALKPVGGALAQVASDAGFKLPLKSTLDRSQSWPVESAKRKLPPVGRKTSSWVGEGVLQRFVKGHNVTRRINVSLVVK